MCDGREREAKSFVFIVSIYQYIHLGEGLFVVNAVSGLVALILTEMFRFVFWGEGGRVRKEEFIEIFDGNVLGTFVLKRMFVDCCFQLH